MNYEIFCQKKKIVKLKLECKQTFTTFSPFLELCYFLLIPVWNLLGHLVVEDNRLRDLTRPNFPDFLLLATFFITDDPSAESMDLGKELAFEHTLGTRGSWKDETFFSSICWVGNAGGGGGVIEASADVLAKSMSDVLLDLSRVSIPVIWSWSFVESMT